MPRLTLTTMLLHTRTITRCALALLAVLSLLAATTPSYAHPSATTTALTSSAQYGRYYSRFLVAGNVLYAHPRGAQANRVYSASGSFEFIMQEDGNLVLYVRSGGVRSPLWASGTAGRAVSHCRMQHDGNLVIYGYDNRPIWASNTAGKSGAYLEVQDDGNAVLYRPTGRTTRTPIWDTGTYAGPR